MKNCVLKTVVNGSTSDGKIASLPLLTRSLILGLVCDGLAVAGWRWLCGRFIDATGHDAEAVELCPQWLHSAGAIAVEVAAAHAHELPARSLKIALPRHVLFVAVGTMPLVTIAFDGEASLHAINDQINTVAMIG